MQTRFLAIAICASLLGGCTVWPVDQDPKGMDYRRNADRVLDAVQAYRRDHGAYPGTLSALTPTYLPSLPDTPALSYRPQDGSLAYRYTPSWPQLRPVWCQSVGDTTEWRCREHLLDEFKG